MTSLTLRSKPGQCREVTKSRGRQRATEALASSQHRSDAEMGSVRRAGAGLERSRPAEKTGRSKTRGHSSH